MKTLVTHINPHLDDIAAIWLFKKFFQGWEKAKIEFISQSESQKHHGRETKDRIYFGTGMGKFDEHKGDIGTCAMSLVWDEIKKMGLAPKDKFEMAAYEAIVRWNLLYDTAQMPPSEFDNFNVEGFIRSFKSDPQDSLITVKLGEQILDRILPKVIKSQKSLADWSKRVEFSTPWGKSMAIESDEFDRSYAYAQGFQVVVQLAPKDHFIGVTAPGLSEVDLTPVYNKLIKKEPDVPWYLHHGKKMILAGSKSAPDAKRSQLTLKEVVSIIKSL